MKTGIILLNFGEPADPTMEAVVPFLERIFFQNGALEEAEDEEARRKRVRELAERRAPGLIEEYREIGGSPLAEQAFRQRELLERELRVRRHDVSCYVGMQFTDPTIPDAVAKAREDGVDLLLGLPVYPLCGRSTNMAALEDMNEAVTQMGWNVRVREITGWHRHPGYPRLHGDHIREFLGDQGVDLYDEGTTLVFSAHGTPTKYLDDGPRYVRYVEEFCRLLARELGVSAYELGYQNHTNRPGLEWTQPDVDEVVTGLGGKTERIVVVAVSFMHEQSETLAELDHELREEAEEVGLEFHRVSVPFEDPRFIGVLADLSEGLIREVPALGEMLLKGCLCRTNPNTYCLNAG